MLIPMFSLTGEEECKNFGDIQQKITEVTEVLQKLWEDDNYLIIQIHVKIRIYLSDL